MAEIPRTNGKPRVAYLDAVRVLAISLVIVNHTLGPWLLNLHSQTPKWWIGAAVFFMCKIAVPLFVMVSGALLLQRSDSYRKTASRIMRIFVALAAASIFYYLMYSDTYSIVDFINKFWHAKILNTLWYLYMYIGLLIMLPLLQRLVSAMRTVDYVYFFIVCFGVVNLLSVAAKFNPAAAYTADLQLPLFNSYIGMFVAGHFIANIMKPTKKLALGSVAVFVACLVFLVAATSYFFNLNGGKNFLAMDDRTFTPIVLMACSVFLCIRYVATVRTRAGLEQLNAGESASDARDTASSTHDLGCEDAKKHGPQVLKTLAACSFGIYLVHAFFIRQLHPFFLQACESLPDLVALPLYQVAIFAASLAVTWLLRLIPPVRKVL